MRKLTAGLFILATLSACGGEKAQPAAETKAAPAPAAVSDPTAAPSVPPATAVREAMQKAAKADTLRPMKGDTGVTTKVDDRPRDSAFGPKYTLDSTGKAVPIKKRP
jgi:hypothetical protein